MDEFMEIVDLSYWADIEKKFEGKSIYKTLKKWKQLLV